MKPTTKRQQDILDIVKRLTEEQGFPPTVAEIAEQDSVSITAVAKHLDALEQKGYISRTPGRNRSIVVL